MTWPQAVVYSVAIIVGGAVLGPIIWGLFGLEFTSTRKPK